MNFNIIKVETPKDKMRFIKSQWNFYKNDKNFVPPLIMDRKKVLDTEKNPLYKHCGLALFMAESQGEIIGRIAAITNGNHNKIHEDNIGFFGFFECIDNQEVANALFAEAEKWLKMKGKDAMRGPANPSFNDEVGLLIEGFDTPPVTLMSYNPPYYGKLIENAGLPKVKNLLAYKLLPQNFYSEKMGRLVTLVEERQKTTIRNIQFNNKKQFALDVKLLKEIYNAAWEKNWGFVKMTDEEFDFLAADLKQVANPDLCFIIESKGKPAGFCLALPDINGALIHNKNGGIIRGVWNLLTRKKEINKIVRIIVLGTLPEYRNTGVDAVMYWHIGHRAVKLGIEYGEASWILEDNAMMNRALQVTMNGEVYKKYGIYEKAF